MAHSATTRVVVDTGPDFNSQLTREKILTCDAVLYTHAHSDHVAGMDDLRIIQSRIGKRLPIYGDAPTLAELEQRFGYIFRQQSSFYPAVVDPHLLDASHWGKVLPIGDLDVIPFWQDHGQGVSSLGYRFGKVGYSTDMIDLDATALEALKGVEVWVADCADYAHGHGTLHSTLENVQRLNAIIKAPQVYLTHLKIFYDYKAMAAALPDGYTPAYDGLQIPC